MDHQARSRSENSSSGKIGTLARGISAERHAVVRPRISLGGVGTSVATIELRAAPPIDSLGCGWGWDRVHWQDHWGYWPWHCVPSGHVYHDARTGLEHPYADWRGLTGGWGNP
jgi:hypothetical protein